MKDVGINNLQREVLFQMWNYTEFAPTSLNVISGRFRNKSEHYGLWVYLCASCHVTGNEAVHSARGIPYSNYLRKIAQERFEMVYGHDKWMKEFKRNWL